MKYRIKEIDAVNDVWILQKRVLWFFWVSLGAGTKEFVGGALLRKQLDRESAAK